jgi:hypothetical protein
MPDRPFVEAFNSEKHELWQRLLHPSHGHEQGWPFLRFFAVCLVISPTGTSVLVNSAEER